MKSILIVEPSAFDAATKLAASYEVVKIPPVGEIMSVEGRSIILWPDASTDSRKSMNDLAKVLCKDASEVKFVIPQGQPDGWNIATAAAQGWSWRQLVEWAKPNIVPIVDIPVTVTEAADPAPEKAIQAWDKLGLALSNNGSPISNIDNVVRTLSGLSQFDGALWYDEFYGRYLTTWNSKEPREWNDNDDLALTLMLQQDYGLSRMGDDTVSKGIKAFANLHKRNEPLEWIKAQRWDGKSRIDSFFIDYFGAESSPYIFGVGRNFWIALVARVFQPGCQVDNMVILEGKQGIFKSKGLEAIGGKWYMEASEEITSKDFVISIQGKLLVEIADLDSFNRADTNRIKKVITCRTDRYRAPYARTAQDNPRRSVFVGTTNENHYLRDNTGARRFWPVVCGRIDLERIKADRSQCFAEARTRYLAGEDWYKMPQDITLEQQELRRQFDEWENVISAFVFGRAELTLTEIADHLGFEKSRLTMPDQKRIGSIMRRLGWNNKTIRRGLVSQKLWFPETDQALEEAATAPLLPLQPSPLPETANNHAATE